MLELALWFVSITLAYLWGKMKGLQKGRRNGYADGWRKREAYGDGGRRQWWKKPARPKGQARRF